jgi:hypothetical protein
MKYHDKRGKIVTIEVDMTGARKCHKNMHRAINTATKEQQEKVAPMETLLIDNKQGPRTTDKIHKLC